MYNNQNIRSFSLIIELLQRKTSVDFQTIKIMRKTPLLIAFFSLIY